MSQDFRYIKPITIEYQLGESDYVAIAGRFIMRNFLQKRVPLLLTLYLAYVAIIAVIVNFDASVWILGIVGVPILIGIVIAFSFFYPSYIYKHEPKLQASYKVEFSENGVAAQGPYGNSNLNWDYYKDVWETGKGYVLGAGSKSPQLIPRKAFRPDQEVEFRQLLQQKLNFGIKK